MVDQKTITVPFTLMSVKEISQKMGVSVRTVYSHIDREGWNKVEGARGRVKYEVPDVYIEEYLRSVEEVVMDHTDLTMKDQSPSQVSSSDASVKASPVGEAGDAIITQVIEAHRETVKAKDDQIEALKKQIEDLKEDKERSVRLIENAQTALMVIKDKKKPEDEEEANAKAKKEELGLIRKLFKAKIW